MKGHLPLQSATAESGALVRYYTDALSAIRPYSLAHACHSWRYMMKCTSQQMHPQDSQALSCQLSAPTVHTIPPFPFPHTMSNATHPPPLLNQPPTPFLHTMLCSRNTVHHRGRCCIMHYFCNFCLQALCITEAGGGGGGVLNLMAARLLDRLQKEAIRKAGILRLNISVTCLSHQHANFTDQSP